MHDAPAEHGGDRAPKDQPASVGPRRETRATSPWVARRERGAWRHRSPLPDNRREPDDDSFGADRVGWPGSNPQESGPTAGWRPDLARKKRPGLTAQLHKVLDGATAGDPMSSVKWTRKSTRSVSRALRVSHTKARRMLRVQKYRLRFNRKRLTRKSSPDRELQFTEINRLKKAFAKGGQPVISVDAKKRELVGPFKNQGRAWGQAPTDVNVYDFPIVFGEGARRVDVCTGAPRVYTMMLASVIRAMVSSASRLRNAWCDSA